jgi:hypothetical protein
MLSVPAGESVLGSACTPGRTTISSPGGGLGMLPPLPSTADEMVHAFAAEEQLPLPSGVGAA